MLLMDKAHIEENHIIKRYNLNKLNDAELNSFEIFILENSRIIREIEEQSRISLTSRQNKALLGTKLVINSNFFLKGVAIAACLFLALSTLPFLPQISPQITPQFSSPIKQQPHPMQTPILLQMLRSNNTSIISTNGLPIVQLQIDAGPSEFTGESTFTIQLVQMPDQNIISTESGLIASPDGWINYSLDSQTSPLVGRYEIRVLTENSLISNTTYILNFIE